MKFTLGLVAVTSLFASTFAAPTATEKRQSACADNVNSALEPSASSIVASLRSQIEPIFSQISDAHTAFASSGDIIAATAAYSTAAGSLTSAFTDANNQVTTLTGVSNDDVKSQYAGCISGLTKRQAATGLQAELEAVLQELTSALQTIVGDLGLTAFLSFLNPLLASLGGLLLSLVPVVNNLLALVQQLLDGLLIGLGLGLGALVL